MFFSQRGSLPSPVEFCILAWVAGLIWSEIKQLWDVGLKEYASDLWNVVDFITNSLYVATIGLRVRAFCDVSYKWSLYLERYLASGLVDPALSDDVNHKTQQSNPNLFVLSISQSPDQTKMVILTVGWFRVGLLL